MSPRASRGRFDFRSESRMRSAGAEWAMDSFAPARRQIRPREAMLTVSVRLRPFHNALRRHDWKTANLRSFNHKLADVFSGAAPQAPP